MQPSKPPTASRKASRDLVDVANRHCPHCRVRVGFLEEQEMTAIRLYRFYRKCGMNRIQAVKKAFVTAFKP
jgi:hypothetical protein